MSSALQKTTHQRPVQLRLNLLCVVCSASNDTYLDRPLHIPL